MRLRFLTSRQWRRPPWAVSIVAALHIAVSAVLLVSLVPEAPPVVDPNCVFDCGGYFVDPWEAGSAPYVMLFALAALVSAVAALFGSRVGRAALLVTAVAFTCFMFVWEVSGTVEMMLSASERDVGLLGAISVWWTYMWLPAWFIITAWLALNFWCLLGAPAAAFYAKNA